MLGRRLPQGELFEADHLYLGRVGWDTFYGVLASLASASAVRRRSSPGGRHKCDMGRRSVLSAQIALHKYPALSEPHECSGGRRKT